MQRFAFGAVLAAAIGLAGCGTPKVPSDALSWTAETAQYRALSRRVYGTSDEVTALRAVSGVLQDLGYQVTEGDHSLGFLSATRAAEGTGFGAQFAVALFGGDPRTLVRERYVRVTVATALDAGARLHVRATFLAVGINGYGQMAEAAKLDDPQLYQTFFARLDKALFLEGHTS